MNLSHFPRRRYTPASTPIEKLEHLTRELGGPDIYIKRDDLLGLAGGGNKTRKLEFLVADALSQGADTLITVGAVQSNHCRLTLAAAIKEGLKCRLVLEERVPNSYHRDASGNNFLYDLLGAEKVTVVRGGEDFVRVMEAEADALAAVGRKGYIIPGGGSNALGALGYVACAQEIVTQSFDMGLEFDHLVCASGSGGTHAGLVAGLSGMNSALPVTGISVRAEKRVQEEKLHRLATEVAHKLGFQLEVPREAFTVHDAYVGEGYSLPTEGMIEAVKRFAQLEGILLDPVYTGKAAAGLIDMVRRGHFKKGESILFLHTGGSPALYAYQGVLSGA